MSLQYIDINSFLAGLYPTPKEPIDSPIDTLLKKGDIVELLEGPARGKLGTIVVERNGNYVDYETKVDPESIGILVITTDIPKNQLTFELAKAFGGDSQVRTEVRRADDASQLRFVSSVIEAILHEDSSILN